MAAVPVRVGVGVSRILAALLVCWVLTGACSASPRDEDLFIRPEDQRSVLFAGADVGRSVFVSGGAKQSLIGSLDRSGFIVVESSGFGLTRERFKPEGADVAVRRFIQQTSALAGYQWNEKGLSVSTLAGPEVESEQLAYAGRFRRFSQPRLGERGQMDVWLNPTSATLLTGTLIASSTRTSVWGRASAGVEVWPKVFLGPEFSFYVTPTYSERRYGVHLTGVALWIVDLRISGGWMEDDAHARGSPYLGLSAWLRL